MGHPVCGAGLAAEVADAGEDHGEVEAVGGGDDLVVAHGAAGLDDCRGAGLGDDFEAVGEGERSVGGGYRAGEGEDGFECSETGGVDAGHLAGADADGLGP